MALQQGALKFSFRDPRPVGRITLLKNLRTQLQRFTEIRVNEFPPSYSDAIASREVPNLQVLEICLKSDDLKRYLPDSVFLGTAPPHLAELSLSHIAVRWTSPLLRSPLPHLRGLCLSQCGDVWKTQDQMFETLRLMPALENLSLMHVVPLHGSSRRPKEVPLPHLVHLSAAATPSGVCGLLTALRVPNNVKFSLELHCGPVLRESSLSPLVPLVPRLYDVSVHGFFNLLEVETYNTKGDDYGLSETRFTSFTLRKSISGGGRPEDLRISISHSVELGTGDFRSLVDFASLVLPISKSTQVAVTQRPWVPKFPWAYFLQNVPAATALTLGCLAPRSIAWLPLSDEDKRRELVATLYGLKELAIVDADLTRESGAVVIRVIHNVFRFAAGSHEEYMKGRKLIVKNCTLDRHAVEYSSKFVGQIYWIGNEVI